MFLTGLSLLRYSADVVLLQEMVQPYMRFMHRRLGDEYAFIEGDWLVLGVVCVTVCVSRRRLLPGGQDGYFTMMLLKKSRLRLLDHHIVNFPKSRMMRNLLVAQVPAHPQTAKSSWPGFYCENLLCWARWSSEARS